MDALGGLGFFILKTVASFIPFGVGLYVAIGVMSKRGVRTWLCWVAGIAIIVVGILIFLPAIELLSAAACRGSADYQECMDEGD